MSHSHSLTLRHGAEKSQHSKPHAVAWALATLLEPWRSTVARSRVWRNGRTSDPAIVPQVRAFVLWATAQADDVAASY